MNRICSECSRPTIKASEEPWKKTCKGCFINKLKTMKKCNTCKSLVIPKDSDKVICNNCYVQETKKCINYRTCNNYIIGTENMWKDKCIPCFKSSMSSKPKSAKDFFEEKVVRDFLENNLESQKNNERTGRRVSTGEKDREEGKKDEETSKICAS